MHLCIVAQNPRLSALKATPESVEGRGAQPSPLGWDIYEDQQSGGRRGDTFSARASAARRPQDTRSRSARAPWRRARLLPDAEAGEDVAQEIVRCLLAGDLLERVRGFL